jgi:hypothetical protein
MPALFDWETKYFQIIFIFADWCDSFFNPDVNSGVTNHASIATSTAEAKWIAMVDPKIAWMTLNDQPWFVVRYDRTSSVELCDIKAAGLSTRGC